MAIDFTYIKKKLDEQYDENLVWHEKYMSGLLSFFEAELGSKVLEVAERVQLDDPEGYRLGLSLEEERDVERLLYSQDENLTIWHMKYRFSVCSKLREEFGDVVFTLVEKYVANKVKMTFSEIAKKEGSNTVKDLIRVLWEVLPADRFEYTGYEKDDGMQMICTKCPGHRDVLNLERLCPDMDVRKWGYLFFCSGDFPIAEGFNPNIGLKRTKTLIEGYDCCNHFYYMKEQAKRLLENKYESKHCQA